MKFSIFLLCILTFILKHEFVKGKHQLQIYLTNVEFTSDEKYFKVNVKFHNNTEHHILIDVDTEAVQDIDDSLTIEIEAYMKSPTTGEYTKLLRTPERNFCHLMKHPEDEPLFAIAFDELKHHGNIIHECPYKKGHYNIKGYKIDPEKLPEITMPGQYRTDMEIFLQEDGKQKQVIRFSWFSTIEQI